MKIKKEVLGLLLMCVAVSLFLFNANLISAEQSPNDTMTVSVNVLDFVDIVGIEVPGFISFGDVTKDEPISDRAKINLNNTGNVAITVTPELVDSSEDIFSYIFFQRVTTSDLVQIGDYTHNISKPSSGSVKSAYFYATLDLSDYNGTIDADMINHTADIIFYALPQ